MKQKYIRTEDNDIILFSSFVKHDSFKKLNPISAGFVDFNIKDGNVVLLQYGESDSLNIKSQD
jgi:hypothetical protein